MRLDLHLHTSCSDGALCPAELVAAARRASLDVIALTDHDTLSGIAPAVEAAATLGGVRILSGVELTCTFEGSDLHLLGYGIDTTHQGLLAMAARLAERRRARVEAIIGKLTALGVAISVADVEPPPGNASVGRPHVAQALVRLKRVGTIQEAFSRWLADGGPAWVPGAGPEVGDGIAAIRDAGGCAVWAHPSLADARRFADLAASGLDGVEALRPSLAPPDSAAIEHAARAAALVITGGSDWHGAPRPALGSWYVTERHIGPFLRRVGLA